MEIVEAFDCRGSLGTVNRSVGSRTTVVLAVEMSSTGKLENNFIQSRKFHKLNILKIFNLSKIANALQSGQIQRQEQDQKGRVEHEEGQQQLSHFYLDCRLILWMGQKANFLMGYWANE